MVAPTVAAKVSVTNELSTSAVSPNVGARQLRLEDDRLLRGHGRFLDDVDLPRQVHARFVRSTVAHGRLAGIDASAAWDVRGVLAVITAEDLGAMGPMRPRWRQNEYDVSPFLQPVLARERVRYVGEPVAVVVAETEYAAEDAAELVLVDVDPLPAVIDALAGAAPDAPALWEGGNEVTQIVRAWGDVDEAFASAAHTIKLRLATGRQAGVPMETRGCLADYDPGRRRLWIRGPLNPASHRRPLAQLLGMAESDLHLVQDDVGGNFGSRAGVYPEHVAIPFLARMLARPVKWIEDRPEHLVATSHAREQEHVIEAAFDDDGCLLGLRDVTWHDIGAYVRPQGLITSEISVGLLWAPYRVPAYHGTVHVITTNKTPICPYRGPGRFEGTFVRERLLDVAARQLALHPAELRRRNLLTADELPYEPGIAILGDDVRLADMDVPGALEKTLAVAGFDAWEREAETLRSQGRLVGVGMAIGVDKSGLGMHETGSVRIDTSGRVRVVTGGFSVGQGIETALAQIAADELGVAVSDVVVTYGDTEIDPYGMGSFASRSTVLGGGAVLMAARATAELARGVAADRLEVRPDDIVLADGRAAVAGAPALSVGLGELAAACDAMTSSRAGRRPGLGADHVYVAAHQNHPYGVTLAQVELDPQTGAVSIRRLFVSAEVGRAVNPLLVEGQLVGGAAQSVGAALLEEFVYDESGQPLTTTFMDYLVPTASEVPVIQALVLEDVPATDNPLGAKGVGETGGLGGGAAIANAIEDALGADRVITRVPVTPKYLHRVLHRQVGDASTQPETEDR